MTIYNLKVDTNNPINLLYIYYSIDFIDIFNPLFIHTEDGTSLLVAN